MGTSRAYRQLDAAIDYKAITADTTLTHSDSGKHILLDATGEDITLPAVAAGLNFKFICTVTTAASNWRILTPGGVNLIFGSAQVAGAVVAASAEDTITLVVAKFLPGDWVSLESDGTSWFVEGSVVTADGCTFTAA
jgi:hypothetical protein